MIYAKLLAILAILTIPAAAADTVPAIGVRGIFLHGTSYPTASHPVQIQFSSNGNSITEEVTLRVFSQHLLKPNFFLPAGDTLAFTIGDRNGTLLNMEFQRKDSLYTIADNCKQRGDLHNIYPYSHFSSHIPQGTTIFKCKTPIGLIEVQFVCMADTPCWPPKKQSIYK